MLWGGRGQGARPAGPRGSLWAAPGPILLGASPRARTAGSACGLALPRSGERARAPSLAPSLPAPPARRHPAPGRVPSPDPRESAAAILAAASSAAQPTRGGRARPSSTAAAAPIPVLAAPPSRGAPAVCAPLSVPRASLPLPRRAGRGARSPSDAAPPCVRAGPGRPAAAGRAAVRWRGLGRAR